jgi:tetratricopeptide (TPR) repeat protein
VFSWSYRALEPAAARLFRLLALHPGQDIGVTAAASLAGTPVRATGQALTALRDANMIVEVAAGRFAMHDLLRAYATGLVGAAERQDALGRLLDHLLHAAAAARSVLYPGRDQADLPAARSGTAVEPAPGVDGARAWFTREHTALTAAVRIAAAGGLDPYAWRLAWMAADFLQRGGHWRDWRDTVEIGLSAARRHGARHAQALLHRNLGHAWSLLDDPDRARTHLSRALDLYVRLGDLTGRAATHRTLGSLLVRLNRVEDALAEDRYALRLYQAADDLGGQALTLNNTAWKHIRLGRHDDAMAIGRQALALYRTAGTFYGEADTWDTVGCVHHHRGEYRAAIGCYRRALDLFRSRGDRYHEADTLTRLGDSLHAAGDPDEAERAWRETTAILVQLNHPEAERERRQAVGPGGGTLLLPSR